MVSKHSTTTTIIAVLSAILVLINPSVEGHGYMLTPRCRQVYAAEFGVGSWHSDSNTLPLPEYCPHCQLVGGQTYGVCGTREEGGRDYTFDWVTGNGTPMPFISQGTYAPGGTILVESVFTANHEGHIVVGICPNVANPTQECFDANQLEFVEDPLYGAPKDVNYPERGYIAPTSADAQTTPDFSEPVYTDGNIGVKGLLVQHVFRLPMDITGEVLLQWHWVSNLGCRSVGYDVYPWPPGWEPYGSMSTVCALPMPDIGNSPQQYWECAEITISGDTSAPVTPAPVTPTTPAPITAAPVTAAPIVPTTPAPITPTTPAPVTAAPITAAPTTAAPVAPTPEHCTYCCSINGQGCPAWNNGCFTEAKCGVTPDCQWQNQEWVMECNVPPEVEGCCAQNGSCPKWTNPCFEYGKCGVDDPSTNTWCSWGGQLSWVGPTPEGNDA